MLLEDSSFKGVTLGLFIHTVIDIDPSIMVSAFVGTSLAFDYFSVATITTWRQKIIFLGGFLGFGVSILMWLQLETAIFGGSSKIYTFVIYFSILVFLGYIISDT